MKVVKSCKRNFSEIIAFTIIESIFVIIAIGVILFVLGGLYLKNNKISMPAASQPTVESPTPLSSEENSPEL